MGGGIDYGLVIDVVALSIVGVLMARMVSRLDAGSRRAYSTGIGSPRSSMQCGSNLRE